MTVPAGFGVALGLLGVLKGAVVLAGLTVVVASGWDLDGLPAHTMP